MPRYDYRCPGGHVTEALRPREEDTCPCPQCGLPAESVVLSPPGVIGFVPRPTREASVNLTRAVEAQHELVHTAQRHGIEPPDPLKLAKERVSKGNVKAI